MAVQPVRIGIVGAGANTRARHIPGFRQIEGVEIAGVVNSSAESTARAAAEFGIPRTYDSWRDLIEDPEIDAVMVGTWPHLHCDVTCAALEAGKHVLTEARMARNASEAHRMRDVARAHPALTVQIVPSPFGLVQHHVVREMIDGDFLGEFRELVVIGVTDTFYDVGQPLHWRQHHDISGLNILTMGILHEAALRWSPPPTRVFAQTTIFEDDYGHSPRFGTGTATVPDSVQIVTLLAGGGRGIYHLGGVHLFGPGQQIHLYGSHGTIRFEISPRERLLAGRAGEKELREVAVPPEKQGGWRVEAEFIGAVRGEERVQFTDFATGVQYMEFTEAVARSAATSQPVGLPLEDVG